MPRQALEHRWCRLLCWRKSLVHRRQVALELGKGCLSPSWRKFYCDTMCLLPLLLAVSYIFMYSPCHLVSGVYVLVDGAPGGAGDLLWRSMTKLRTHFLSGTLEVCLGMTSRMLG